MRARILLIDDEPMIISALGRVLGREHDLAGETSARAALARLESGEAFDLVICDLMMPTMTGMDVYERLSATHPAVAARMVFMTGCAVTDRAKQFVASGVRCIHKPFDIPDLRRTIRSLVRRS